MEKTNNKKKNEGGSRSIIYKQPFNLPSKKPNREREKMILFTTDISSSRSLNHSTPRQENVS